MAMAYAEMVVAIVAEAEAVGSENKDSGGGIEGDSGGNIGIGGGSSDSGWQTTTAVVDETGSAVAVVATVAMAVEDNNRTGAGSNQQMWQW